MIYLITGVHEGIHYKAKFREASVNKPSFNFLADLLVIFYLFFFFSFFFCFALNIIFTFIMWIDRNRQTV